MNRSIVFIALLVTGCSLSAPVLPDKPDSPVVVEEHAPAEMVFQALARSVKNGQIRTTTDLAKTVLVLGRNGDLSETDILKLDAAFPGYTIKESPLDKDASSALLKGLK